MDDSPLAKLPGELRTYIYELVVQQTNPIVVCSGRCLFKCRKTTAGSASNRNRKHHLRPLYLKLHLTRTCRQVRAESKLLFFKVNTFIFHRKYIRDLMPAFDHALRFTSNECINAMGKLYMSINPSVCFCQRCNNRMDDLRIEFLRTLDRMRKANIEYPGCKFVFNYSGCYAPLDVHDLNLGSPSEPWDSAIQAAGGPWLGNWKAENAEEAEYQQDTLRRAQAILRHAKDRRYEVLDLPKDDKLWRIPHWP